MSQIATHSTGPASLALVIRNCPRWPEPIMPSRMRSFAPQTRRAAAVVAAPTIKVLREILFVTSILLPWRMYESLWLQSRDDEGPLHTTNLGFAREGQGQNACRVEFLRINWQPSLSPRIDALRASALRPTRLSALPGRRRNRVTCLLGRSRASFLVLGQAKVYTSLRAIQPSPHIFPSEGTECFAHLLRPNRLGIGEFAVGREHGPEIVCLLIVAGLQSHPSYGSQRVLSQNRNDFRGAQQSHRRGDHGAGLEHAAETRLPRWQGGSRE